MLYRLYTPPGFDRWKFLEQTVLPNVNLVVSSGSPELRDRWERWRAQGKRWIVECPLPGLGKDSINPDEVEKVWLDTPDACISPRDGCASNSEVTRSFGSSEGPKTG